MLPFTAESLINSQMSDPGLACKHHHLSIYNKYEHNTKLLSVITTLPLIGWPSRKINWRSQKRNGTRRKQTGGQEQDKGSVTTKIQLISNESTLFFKLPISFY